jgi:hypothetical protein
MRITRNGAIAAAAAVAIALTSVATPASAGRYNRHRSAGNAAVLGAVAAVFGTIAAVAAQRQYERRYRYQAYDPYYGPPPAPYRHHYGYRPY